jgi:membrane-associated phospholipid phosphatase
MPLIFWIGILAQQNTLAADSTEKNVTNLQNLIFVLGIGRTIFYEDGNQGTIQFFKSFVTSQVITEGLKLAIDKNRPNGNCCNSFPSGHTSKAFMGASFIHKRYGWKFATPAYIAATYVGYSRVEADKHYVEDVVAGAAIGILSSFYFTTPYQGLEVTPVVSRDLFGINISYKW